MFPALVCAVAVGGGVRLKLHFDDLLAQVEATGSPIDLVDDVASGRDPATGSADADPTGPETMVASQFGPGPPTELEPAPPPSAADPSGGEDGDGGGSGGAAYEGWVDPDSSGHPWSTFGAIEGLLTFRGNPTRTYYGRGPIPTDPGILWRHEIGCSISPVGAEVREWCGTGWTGQPAVFPHPTGDGWVVAFGGYDRQVTFLDPATGGEALAPYPTGDIIKGSITIDPDGYPLLYTGSRDNFFHVVALDRQAPMALWQLSSEAGGETLWNNDWDGSGLIIDDHLFVGGENGRFYIVRLNRGYDPDGLVTVDPEIVFSTESWDDELLAAIGDVEVSVENSVAISGDTVYFANSGGLVQGWDIGGVADGRTPERVFRFWTGDDTDATVVVDADGMLYVGSEYQRENGRSRELGQIFKLDPSRPDDPVVWSRDARSEPETGVWATPALWQDLVIVGTDDGEVLGLDRETGATRWRLAFDGPVWSSPVVVDDVLIQATCDGFLRAFDLVAADTGPPTELWEVELGGCIESTPAVWDGRIYIGSRSGWFFAVGDRPTGTR